MPLPRLALWPIALLIAAVPTLHGEAVGVTTPRAPTAVSQIELNGDGHGDAFFYDAETGYWSRQLSAEDGEFVEESQGQWAPGWSVLPANFDSNVLTDLFLFNRETGAWSKMINDGPSKTFVEQSSGVWWPGWQIFVTDLNPFGGSDLFLHDPVTGQWFKCLSTAGGFNYSQGAWAPGWEVTQVSLNNDAYGDFFLIDRESGQWFWVLGRSGPDFFYPYTGAWFPSWEFSPGDFNADGMTDLLLYDSETGSYFVSTTTSAGFAYTNGDWSPGWTPYVADLDADGRDDLFLHSATTGGWYEMISDGQGSFTNIGGEVWSEGWTLSPTDADGDGRADMLLYHQPTGTWNLARNLGNGSFTYTGGAWAPGLTMTTRATNSAIQTAPPEPDSLGIQIARCGVAHPGSPTLMACTITQRAGLNPYSSNINVTVDLSVFGKSANSGLWYVTGSSGEWDLDLTVPAEFPPGSVPLTFRITDAEGRVSTAWTMLVIQ